MTFVNVCNDFYFFSTTNINRCLNNKVEEGFSVVFSLLIFGREGIMFLAMGLKSLSCLAW